MAEIITRLITRADLPDVLRMARDLADHHGDTATLTLRDLERDALDDHPWVTVILAQRDGSTAGYAALCPLVQMQFGVRGMDMHHLFVRPDARGHGVGRALIDASLRHARGVGCRYMMVGTHPDNVPAQDIYRAAGFSGIPAPGPRFRIKFDAP